MKITNLVGRLSEMKRDILILEDQFQKIEENLRDKIRGVKFLSSILEHLIDDVDRTEEK